MLSTVRRYKALVSGALSRCFPRTTAYLKSEDDALFRRWPKAADTGAGKREATAKPGAPRRKGKKATAEKKAAADKPGGGRGARRSAGIYPSRALEVAPGQVAAMRERAAQAVQAGVICAPSDEQWRMILCDSPLTRIFAGAGSGKSTTLVLRVVFMLCHLQVPVERLTVISFTNASCAQLREQLIRVLAFWGGPFDEAQARQCVRTFHSAMAQLAREVLGEPSWFEQLDERAPGEPDNPLASARLRSAQQRLLKQVYQRLYRDDATFREQVGRLLGQAPVDAKAPMDTLRLAGEYQAKPLFEALHAQLEFCESIALDFATLDTQRLPGTPREQDFVAALARFREAFYATLESKGLTTFNRAFAALTERLAQGAVAAAPLQRFQHLVIDEFQDISPQIVRWLQALHRALAGSEAVSLMAIGDDWQSIYGWRGSSPELFIDFDRHFPRKGSAKSTVLKLETNYRSIEPVIRDAEALLDEVRLKQAKRSRAGRSMQPGDHGVKLVSGFDSRRQLPALIEEIQRQCTHVASRTGADRTAVLLLSRRNEPLQAIQGQLQAGLPVKAMTIHRAKGLQAEVAIIVDDCLPSEPHPLRNALYAASGFFGNSYDEAMADEGLRLAYVAVTRGVSRVLWYTGRVQGATRILQQRQVRT